MEDPHEFTVTHPFHPLRGQTYPILSRHTAWGEARVQFLDPATGRVRWLPIDWTSLGAQDPFVEMAQGRAVLRMVDLEQLSVRLRELKPEQE